MKVLCISCGHMLDLRDAYDDYEGKVRCFICRAMLAIQTRDGQLKSVDLAASPRLAGPPPTVDVSGEEVLTASMGVASPTS